MGNIKSTQLFSVERYRTNLATQDIVMYKNSIFMVQAITHYEVSDSNGSFEYYNFHLINLILDDYLVVNFLPDELDSKLTYLKKTPNLLKLLDLEELTG